MIPTSAALRRAPLAPGAGSLFLNRSCYLGVVFPIVPDQELLARRDWLQDRRDKMRTNQRGGCWRGRRGDRKQLSGGRRRSGRARRGGGIRERAGRRRALGRAPGQEAEPRPGLAENSMAGRAKARHSGQTGGPGSLSRRLAGVRVQADLGLVLSLHH